MPVCPRRALERTGRSICYISRSSRGSSARAARHASLTARAAPATCSAVATRPPATRRTVNHAAVAARAVAPRARRARGENTCCGFPFNAVPIFFARTAPRFFRARSHHADTVHWLADRTDLVRPDRARTGRSEKKFRPRSQNFGRTRKILPWALRTVPEPAASDRATDLTRTVRAKNSQHCVAATRTEPWLRAGRFAAASDTRSKLCEFLRVHCTENFCCALGSRGLGHGAAGGRVKKVGRIFAVVRKISSPSSAGPASAAQKFTKFGPSDPGRALTARRAIRRGLGRSAQTL